MLCLAVPSVVIAFFEKSLAGARWLELAPTPLPVTYAFLHEALNEPTSAGTVCARAHKP